MWGTPLSYVRTDIIEHKTQRHVYDFPDVEMDYNLA